ncbi:MAG: HAD-IA family hydrolase [Spirochaetes bacterium]|nr:HAD-IA family hydrolase [Spirochaetota bacterium]
MYVIFDLGGVLIEFPGIQKLLEWSEEKTDQETFKEKWLLSENVKKFETGKTNENEFAENVIKEFKFKISKKKFLKKFSNFCNVPYPGINKLIKKLSKLHVLGILSNTNSLHWNKLIKKIKFIDLIKYKFLSYKIGFVKPDNKIYKFVVKKLQCKPEEIVYFDDNIINVEAAKKIGIKSYKVNGLKELKKIINDLFF